MNAANARALGILLSVFVLGGVAGAGAAFAYTRHEMRELWAGSPHQREGFRLRALSRELDLTAEQRDEVRQILERHRAARAAAADDMLKRCGDGLRAEKKAVDDEIRAILNDSQKARFDAIASRQGQRFFGFPHH